MDMNREFDLERDLRNIPELRNTLKKHPELAQKMYAALCNVTWMKVLDENDELYHVLRGEDLSWSCSWRYAGGIISDIVSDESADGGFGYLNYYCSGNEGYVDPDISDLLRKYGWEPLENDNDDYL